MPVMGVPEEIMNAFKAAQNPEPPSAHTGWETTTLAATHPHFFRGVWVEVVIDGTPLEMLASATVLLKLGAERRIQMIALEGRLPIIRFWAP